MTKEEALVQMTMRWLEAEARLQQAEARLQKSVPLDAVENLRAEVLQRTPHDLHGTFDRLFAELIGKTGKPQGVDAVTLVDENAALRRRLDNACAALRLGMGHLKGFYPVPYKEAEVLATMQAAIDDANKKEKP